MNDKTYTYRIRLSDTKTVNVEKQGPNNNDRGHPSGDFQLNEDRKTKITELKAKAAIDEDEIIELGTALFEALFDSELKNDLLLFYDEVVHKNDALLRIELDINEKDLPFIASLPWEFLHVPSNKITGNLWLATSPDVVFSRHRARWVAPEPIQLDPGEKLRISIIVSAPRDKNLGKVDYQKLYKELQELTADLGDNIDLELVDPEQQPATRQNIGKVLERKPHIFHFIGHGQFTKKGEQDIGEIAVVRDNGLARWVSAAQFSNLFTRHRPGIVFLQACEGGQLSSSTAFAGVASQIVQQNIPVVMAMQYEVSNATARRFAREFYERLAKGEPVDKAAQEGRNRIADWHETRDFATPVLFMRVRNGRLFQRKGGATSTTSVATQPTSGGVTTPPEPIEIPPAPATLTLPQVASLGRQISQNFNEEELRGFCLEIGIDYEDLRGSSKSSKARELVDYCRRQGKVPLLWEQLHIQRPHIKWQV
ncbi:MAG: CHAT domain-containing protein [Aquificales bacterium]|nr:CHAT domain-containing protein [Aquificales bacterium]